MWKRIFQTLISDENKKVLPWGWDIFCITDGRKMDLSLSILTGLSSFRLEDRLQAL